MALKAMAKRIGDIAFRIAMSGCGCGGECGACDRQCVIPRVPTVEGDGEGPGTERGA